MYIMHLSIYVFKGKDPNLFIQASISITIYNIYFETQMLGIVSLFPLTFLL